jgi:hypothetical protein
LLLFEGALRKWVFPGWSSWLLVARDPVVILIYLIAMSKGWMLVNRWLMCAAFVVVASFLISVAQGHPLVVALYGLRTNLLHLPLIFLLPRILTESDVWRIGRLIVLLAAPMALLATLQFLSPRFAWLNVGAGGDAGGQLFAASGKIRPSGTFSFVTGMVSFLSLVAAFLLADGLDRRRFGTLVRWIAIPSLVLSLGIAGSRSALVGVAIVFGCFLVAALLFDRKAWNVLGSVCLIFGAYLGLTLLPIFREGLQIQKERFVVGGGVEHGVIFRYLGQLGESLAAASYAPPFGEGLGMGTNVAAGLLTGQRQFLLAEGEWARVVLESGPLLGYAYILLRVALGCVLAVAAWKAARVGRPAALVLLGACVLDVMTGQFGQPTTLGFAVFGAGLTLAMCRAPAEVFSPDVVQRTEQLPVRGRGVFAEMLHAKRRS